MRIGVNCFLLEAPVGGIKQYFLALFDWLLEHDLDNQYVFFYSERNLCELEKLRSPRWRSQAKPLASQDQIADHLSGLDLYFCPFNTLWPRPVSIPSVVTLVDIQEVFYPHFFTSEDLRYRAYHYPSSTRAADRVVTISEFSKASIARYHGVRESKIVVAHLCADPLYFEAATIAMPPDPPIPFSQFLFFPANRWPHKNHDTLLRALKILKARGESANVVFTGFDVPGGYSIQAKAVEYGVSDCVYSAGYVTVPQMAYLYQCAEMTVFPSLFEGFGMPPVEAMAVGCPVVVATSSCLPEICGEAAEYFDPADPEALAQALDKVRADADLRSTLVRNGRLRAKQFSAESMARAHLRAFVEAVDSYSTFHFRWHKHFYQPYHKRRVENSIVSSPKKAIRQAVSFTLGWCAWQLRKHRLRGLKKEIELIQSSGLFDERFYRSQVSLGRTVSPLEHYLLFGSQAKVEPNPIFSGSWYLQSNPDVAASGLNPLVHFILAGAREGRNPHPLFDLSWYLERNPDVGAAGFNPLAHYLNFGAAEGRNPHPFFQASFYLASVPDYTQARLNPLAHYLAQGPGNAKDPHPMFDGVWYLKTNPDVARAGINPLVHFVMHGSLEGRDPNPSSKR